MQLIIHRNWVFELVAAIVLLALQALPTFGQSTTAIFSNDRIGFGSGQSREIRKAVTFPVFGPNDKISLDWDVLGDADPWDRAGSIHVLLPGGKQIQLGKFVTGFNGTTSHSQDISDLAPLLSGKKLRVEAFIDTWVPDAWHFNASVTSQAGTNPNPNWVAPVISRDTSFGRGGAAGDTTNTYTIDVPEMHSGKLTYFASGHHDNQTGNSDEFNQRMHHISVDGVEVWSGIPWRTDGPNFRSVNPTSARWDGNNDGDTSDPYPTDYWSSDFARSGWVPGDEVTPYEIDMSPYLIGGGSHEVSLTIDDMDVDSFWRVSAFLSGTLFNGPKLELSVDPLTGEATLTNNGQAAFEFDGYIIESASGSLTPGNWLSLDDQQLQSWRESNPTTNTITELEPGGGTNLQPSESLSLGSLFDPNGTQDLSLKFLMPEAPEGWLGEAPEDWAGAVKYEISSDFDGDGDVDSADLASWNSRYGADLHGSDFLAWQRQLGSSTSAVADQQAIPEPSSLLMAVVTAIGLIHFCRDFSHALVWRQCPATAYRYSPRYAPQKRNYPEKSRLIDRAGLLERVI